jgi:alpha-1,2-mannosyltransferase
VSSVLDRLRLATPGKNVQGTRLLIAGAVALVAVLAMWLTFAALHPTGYTLFPTDLGVYRDGGLIVRHVSPYYDGKHAYPLYDWTLRVGHNVPLQFTYSPFAAVVFAVVSFVPWSVLPRLSQIGNLLALFAAAYCTMRALGYRDRRILAGGALLGTAAGLLTEPVFRTMYLGQINLFLMALIIWDLNQPDTPSRRRWKGLATGFAAGIKLVPLIFIPYLLLARKFRQAAMATAGFAASVALGFIVVPADSTDYWLHHLVFNDARTGFVGWGGNQSLRAIATRLAGSINSAALPWIVGVLLVTVLGLLCAAMFDRVGYPMLGLLTAALVGLLDSPISWDHHWVWVVPGIMVAVHYAVRAWQAGHRRAAFGCAAVAAGMQLVFAPWPGGLWSLRTSGPGNFTHGLIWAGPDSPVKTYVALGDKPWFLEYHWSGLQVIAGNAYVLAGLALLAILGFTALTSPARARAAEPRPLGEASASA